jgi:ABC-type amino acid transport substrate-binding protein
VYNYSMIKAGIDDVAAGRCDAFMKLAPVLTELVRHADGVQVVLRGISTERIAIAVRRGNSGLQSRLCTAQASVDNDGRLAQIRRKWLGSPLLDQSAPFTAAER